LQFPPDGVGSIETRTVEATVNVQGFEELKRVLSKVPQRDFNISNWKHCACGHATHDEWFQRQGFTSCHNFGDAAAFFRISYTEARALFSGQTGCLVTPIDVIEHIDAFVARSPESGVTQNNQHSRRQVIIDSLLARANKAAQKARRVATALVGALF
jgi:hypothetical protein